MGSMDQLTGAVMSDLGLDESAWRALGNARVGERLVEAHRVMREDAQVVANWVGRGRLPVS